MSCSGINPNCCDETNPDCCAICDCFTFTSTNSTLDINKSGCTVDLKITSNLLQGLIDIPSGGCITIVKQFINGKLIFTPTLNVACVQALIPDAPVIPDVPVYTADNGLLMSNYNTELGGGDSSPLVHNTAIALGTPSTPYNLRTYQNDSTNTKALTEHYIGFNGLYNTNRTTIASGITDADTISVETQLSNSYDIALSTLHNRQTDIAFLSPSYLGLFPTYSLIGFNVPITLNSVTNAAPGNDTETTSYFKAYSANVEVYGKNILLNSTSPILGNIISKVINGVVMLTSSNSNPTYVMSTYPIDIINNNVSIIYSTPALIDIETFFSNDRDTGSFYASTMMTSDSRTISSPSVRIGVFCPNTTSSTYVLPAIDINRTAYTIYNKALVNVFGKEIFFNGKVRFGDVSTSPYSAGQSIPCAAVAVDSITGGFLLPRMTTLQRVAITAPAGGLKVFDIDMGAEMLYNGIIWTGYRYNTVTVKFEGYNGTTWLALN